MKKKLILSFVAVLLFTSFLDARLRLDQDTGMYYSVGANGKINKHIDQDEYDDLAEEYLDGNYHISEMFASLKMIGTPAALQLLEDYILLIQEMREFQQRIYQ